MATMNLSFMIWCDGRMVSSPAGVEYQGGCRVDMPIIDRMNFEVLRNMCIRAVATDSEVEITKIYLRLPKIESLNLSESSGSEKGSDEDEDDEENFYGCEEEAEEQEDCNDHDSGENTLYQSQLPEGFNHVNLDDFDVAPDSDEKLMWNPGMEFQIGMIFPNRDSVQACATAYSVENGREHKIRRTTNYTIVLVCRYHPICKWWLRVTLLQANHTWTCTKYIGPHTCNELVPNANHRNFGAREIAKSCSHEKKERRYSELDLHSNFIWKDDIFGLNSTPMRLCHKFLQELLFLRLAMEFKLLFLCFLVHNLLFVSLSNSILDQNGKNPDRDNLLSFKASLQNPTLLSSWNLSTPHCSWVGVGCLQGRVTSLLLSDQSLNGPLHPSLFSIFTLTALDLSKNQLSGEISPQISALKRLKQLCLGENQLSGEIPSQIGELSHLQILRLGDNSFSGNIPPEFGKLTQLDTLDLSANALVGTVPSQIGHMTGLRFLDMGNNMLSGSLPKPFYNNLKSLVSLDISNNSFSGPIPPEIGNLTNLTDLYIGINSFSGLLPPQIGSLSKLENFFSPSCLLIGPLPDQISNLKSLNKLDLSYNPLKCSIPKSLGKLHNLSILNLAYSELNGSIPGELGNCKSLRTLMLSFNSLTGSLPEELSHLPMLTFSAEKNQLSGSLPSWIGGWDQMEWLFLSSNEFSGRLPPEIGNCSSLKHISLSNNLLTGTIPGELCNAVSLMEIDLDGNFFSGTIEDAFLKCANLTQLVLVNNQITGSIPDYLAKLPLMVLDLDSNNFTGAIPLSLWKSTTLMEFSASNNLLKGSLTMEIGNAVELQRLVLSSNMLIGTIPKEIGYLTSLSVLNLNSNLLEGNIPDELGDCISLTTLDLGNNRLNGSIPDKLVDLVELQCLVLSHNNLSGSIPSKPSTYFREANIPDSSFLQHHGVFDLSHNMLSGSIPEELGNLVVIVNLLINDNMLSGAIPGSLSRLSNLTTLDLSGNVLSGHIPPQVGHSTKLQGLYLGKNQLSGIIPESLGNLGSLVKLNLTGNKLYGSIPLSFGNLKELTHLDISNNELVGRLPSSLSHMLNLVGLYVQQNRLSGSIDELLSDPMAWKIETLNLSNNLFDGGLPRSLCNLSYLTYLDFHGNKLTGEIPAELGDLMQLQYFDVSGNRLSGQIPEKICTLDNLFYLNLSENSLEGPVPRNGICLSLSKVSVAGNKNLCGRIIGSECRIRSFGRLTLLNAWGYAGIAVGCMIIILTVAFALRSWSMRGSRRGDPEDTEESKLSSFMDQHLFLLSSSRSKEPLSINIAMFERPLLKITLVDILEATNNFCKTNIIGDGGFGTVYKATLPDGKTVAVKKLSEAKTQGNREFVAEMETLGKVKHQNLVPLLGYCSFGEEKLLVYEYMVNGSLDSWLRNRSGPLEVLDWTKRYKIATGSARGLAFLHHGFIPHIIHRDVKASNILLNGEFEPKVADFGLARLISACETHVSTDIAGTFGYIPPEYGQSGRSTTRGDVYSFGVILLELVTGKEPTGPDFKEVEGGNLVGWVFQKMKKGQAADVLDPTVANAESKKMMIKVLKIASYCLCDNPADRPTMLEVLKLLKGIKGDKF
ncbi:leucine-rich repeat receptor protein kinase EMS1 [Mercurialis annua]|uniref:leucine-rich repeat receptor protein kinase EMS1 n=1 Tax=Mercurialis annua TaxID=3986 RepID=UPI002160C005|nr:leucine-rich repeat receptor protein kinase EMS1 [Mercurialis annua]